MAEGYSGPNKSKEVEDRLKSINEEIRAIRTLILEEDKKAREHERQSNPLMHLRESDYDDANSFARRRPISPRLQQLHNRLEQLNKERNRIESEKARIDKQSGLTRTEQAARRHQENSELIRLREEAAAREAATRRAAAREAETEYSEDDAPDEDSEDDTTDEDSEDDAPAREAARAVEAAAARAAAAGVKLEPIDDAKNYLDYVKCGVCTLNIKNIRLNCGHMICSTCAYDHRLRNCPLCRKPITNRDEVYYNKYLKYKTKYLQLKKMF